MQFNFARFIRIYYIYDRNFALHYPKRSESIRVLGTDRKSVMMSRVKVNSKSELIEERERKSAPYGVVVVTTGYCRELYYMVIRFRSKKH